MKCSAAGNIDYFEGQLRDETGSLRLVGFDASQQQKMADHQEQQIPITLENCEIRKSRYSDTMEVVIRKSTAVMPSPKKLDTVSYTHLTLPTKA